MDFRNPILTAALASAAILAASDVFVGNWTLNVEKSKTSSGAPFSARTMSIQSTSDGYRIKLSTNGTDLILRLDGHDYPREPFGVAKAVGADAVTARRIDGRTIETTFKRNGKPVATVQREVSGDGRVLTATLDAVLLSGEKRHNIEVFEKR